VRPTDDVDLVVEVAGYGNYAGLEQALRRIGFANDQTSGVICRFLIKGIIVDVMPTDSTILGFTNRWYAAGFASAQKHMLNDGEFVRLFTPAYFVASKLEAFRQRGKDDGRFSTYFEDIVFLLNNCSGIWEAMTDAPIDLRIYLLHQWQLLIGNNYLDEWISAHLDFQEKGRLTFIKERLLSFVMRGSKS
jgi:predicted nucleotidyltransferase